MNEPALGRGFGFALWSLGMLGGLAVVLTWPAVSISGHAVQPPSLLGYAVVLALAVKVGGSVAPGLGLRAPVVEALTSRRPVIAPLGSQLVPGVLGGAVGALIAIALVQVAPADNPASLPYAPSLMTRVLGGGITEEIFFRWGTMALVLWVLWRVFQRKEEKPRPLLVWGAITISAVLFGAYHLPGVAALTGPLSPEMVAYVFAGPAAFGFVAGALFWRYGLEAAIIAHAMTHVFHDVAYAL
jgi:membrane protease YdiL (CAAX protease family)